MLSKFNTKIDKILAVISFAFVAQIFTSYSLWNPADRDYPMVTAWGSIFPSWDERAYAVFFGLILISIIGVGILKFKRLFLTITIAILGLAILQDVLRLQAWVYQYLMMFMVAWWYYKKPQEREDNAIWALKWVFVGTYFWSGFHKLNPHFADQTFVWLMQIFELTTPLADQTWAAYGLGCFELLLGVALLVSPIRKLAVIMITVFHLGILTFLISDSWNPVVYPWNMGMILMVWLLFWKDSSTTIPILQTRAFRKLFPNLAIFLLFAILPFLQTFRAYPYNFSLGMYSALSVEGNLVFNDRGADCFPPNDKLLHEMEIKTDTSGLLKLDDWATLEFETPSFPTIYTHKAIARKYCKCINKHAGYLEILTTRRFEAKTDTMKISCKELLSR